MIQMQVNGKEVVMPEGSTVASLVDGMGRDRRGIAVAVNETVVPRGLWETTRVRGGDRVEILTAAQGG